MTLIVPRELEESLLARVQKRLRQRGRNQEQIEAVEKAVAERFINFLPYWHFKSRETGEIYTFGRCPMHKEDHPWTLWDGQKQFAELTDIYGWIYALKAGKLGFTELECAFDGWRVLFGQQNSRVHLFSRDLQASMDLLVIVKFGLTELPTWMKPLILEDEPGGNTTRSMKIYVDEKDERSIFCYAAGASVSIDQSCQHAHVDELARMPFAEKTWSAVKSTVAPGGTCHIVTRGAGEDVYGAELWRTAEQGETRLHPFFVPWNKRPRPEGWREQEVAEMTVMEGKHWVPETAEDALAGDDTDEFLPVELWDRCRDTDVPPFDPGDPTIAVAALDAGVRNDCFAFTLVTRHPEDMEKCAIRRVRLWTPPKRSEVDLSEPEDFVRAICLGGCIGGHWKGKLHTEATDYWDKCEFCVRGEMMSGYNVYEVAYDTYQLENSAQRLRRDGINMRPFPQMGDRLIADSQLRDMAINRRVTHDGNEQLREHIENAAAKIDPREERKIRIIKKAPHRKIDLAVSTSMAVYRCMRLRL